MSVTTMCSREEYEAALRGETSYTTSYGTTHDVGPLADYRVVRDYPGHTEGEVHHCGCPHDKGAHYCASGGPVYDTLRPECAAARCWRSDALYMRTEHRGLVLRDMERNGYDDSDFYAVVWSWELGRTVNVTYASTRGWTYPNRCTVDATPDVVAAYQAWLDDCHRKARAAAAEQERRRVARGKRVRVIKGRKVPRGTEGECFWHGAGTYGPRVGIRDDSGAVHWTAESNVEVVL